MRAARVFVGIGKVLGLAVVFLVSAVVGLLVHLNLPAANRMARARVNEVLAETFRGKVEITRIGGIDLRGEIEGIDAEAHDPEGRRVLLVRGGRVRVSVPALVRSALDDGPLVVPLPELSVDAAEVVLEKDGSGKLGIARTFESKEPPSEGARPTEIRIEAATLAHVWVHGALSDAAVLDADVDEIAGNLTSKPEQLSIHVDHAKVRGRGNPGLDPSGTVQGRAAIPAKGASGLEAAGRFEGTVGAVVVEAGGSLADEAVDVVLDAEASPEAIAAITTAVRPTDTVRLHATVGGALPELYPTVELSAGPSEVRLSGTVVLPGDDRPGTEATIEAAARAIDLSAFHAEAPASKLSADVAVDVVLEPETGPRGSFAVRHHAGVLDGTWLPPAQASGTFDRDAARASAHVDEPGAPTDVSLAVSFGGTTRRADFAVVTTVPELGAVERLGDVGRGAAEVFAEGAVDLDARSIDARLIANASNVAVRGVQTGFVTVRGSAVGPFDAPELAVNVDGAGLRSESVDYAYAGFRVRASGTPERFDVEAALAGDPFSPSVKLAARVGVADEVRADDVRLAVERDGVHATAQIASVRARDGVVQIDDARIEGLGDPIEATVRAAQQSVDVRAKSGGIDLARVAHLTRREPGTRGRLAFDVDLAAKKDRAKGRAVIDLFDVQARGYGPATLHLDATIEDRTIRGRASAALDGSGRVDVAASPVVVGGPLLSRRSWERATGTVDVRASANLAKALSHVPQQKRPVAALDGRLDVQGRATRTNPDVRPDIDVQLLTTGLSVTMKADPVLDAQGSVLESGRQRRIEGVDATLRLKAGGKTGETELEARVRDARGHIVTLDAQAKLPIDAMLAQPRRALELAADIPLDASLSIPRRSLETLPAALGTLPFDGEIAMDASLQGSLRVPKIDIRLRARDLRATAGKLACEHPIELEAALVYRDREATLEIDADSRGRSVLRGSIDVKADLPALVERKPTKWQASGDITLEDFPLEVAQAALGKPVTGTASGKLSFRDLHRAASLDAEAVFEDVTIAGSAIPHTIVQVGMKDGQFKARSRLRQRDGRAAIEATGALAWGTDIAPRIRKEQPVKISFEAKSFRLNVLQPFLQGTLNELDGRIDGKAVATLKNGGKDGQVDGSLQLRDGVFSAPQIGERFSSIKGRVTMKPWGTLRLDDFSARAPTGRLTANANAVFSGFALKTANAKLVIAEGESIPVTVEGVPMGRAHGTVVASARSTPDGKRIDVNINVPLLEVELPRSTGNRPQPLDPPEHIRVGYHDSEAFRTVALDKPKRPRRRQDVGVRATIKLGREVRIQRDTTVDVKLRGQLVVDANGETNVRGQIRIARGEIELQGKIFKIDRGVVTFTGDPSNPQVNATAYWEAPEGTRVYVDFTGTPKDGKLELRSDPALSQDEIIALIMFGSPDGTFGASGSQDTGTAAQGVGLAGGLVTQGLNRIISGITTADITTRIDTSEASNPKPEVAVQLTSRVSARVGYKVGVPPPGDNPDRATITLDWRFFRNWSVSAEVGDQGSTAVDLVWRMRY